ncbi:MaoC family dehydratase [Agrobacterium sp. MOPV5]|nr:MaoC family dehydratase [Agrobacterium leguminum]MBG0511020.1 MaoC family dehydratase [Agrobacterium leguminum]
MKRREFGNFLEDFTPGKRFEHWPGRTITEADNIQFSLMTMNRHPLHCDSHFAAQTEFKSQLVNSGLTLAIVLGMTVDDISFNAIANLGWKDITLSAPVRPGDTIYAQSEVIDVRQSRSRPGQGIVTTQTQACRQDSTVFMTFTRMCLVPTRAEASAMAERSARAEQ